jgi:ubiquinone/menaquinone biosynthesis C-methylase UbiE
MKDTDLPRLERRQMFYYDEEYSKYATYKLENWRISYLQRVFSLLDLSLGDSFLDVGVGGAGYTNIEVAKKGITSIGVDISSIGMRKAWQFAKKNSEGKSVYCHFIVASATSLPLRNDVATKIVSIAVLEHVPDDKAAISEISRVARTESKLLITVPNALSRVLPFLRYMYKRHDTRLGHLRHYTAEEIAMRFSEYDLGLSDVIYHAHIPRLFSFFLSLIFGESNSVVWRLW